MSFRRCVLVHGVQGPAGRGRHGHNHAQRHRHRYLVFAIPLRTLVPNTAVQKLGVLHQFVLPGYHLVRIERVRLVRRLLARIPRVLQHNWRRGVDRHHAKGRRPQRIRPLHLSVRLDDASIAY